MARSEVKTLRRSLGGFVMCGFSFMWFVAAASSGVMGFVGRDPVGVVLFASCLFIGLSVPCAFVVRISDRELRAGFRCRPRTAVGLDEIATVTVGRSEGYGAYGIATNSMLLHLVDGSEEFIWESRYCSMRRLMAWARLIHAQRPEIAVEMAPIGKPPWL